MQYMYFIGYLFSKPVYIHYENKLIWSDWLLISPCENEKVAILFYLFIHTPDFQIKKDTGLASIDFKIIGWLRRF